MKQLIGCVKVYLKLSFRVRAKQAQNTVDAIGRTFGYIGIALQVHMDIATKQYEEAHAAELAALNAAAEAEANAKSEADAAAAKAAAAEEERLAKIEQEKIDRAKQAERAEKLRLAQEKAQKDKENSELWKL